MERRLPTLRPRGPSHARRTRDHFPFMELPAELRIQIYRLDMPSKDKGELILPGGLPKHTRGLLSVRPIREDMLPHLFTNVQVIWAGADQDKRTEAWKAFQKGAIPHIEHLTVRIDYLTAGPGTALHQSTRDLLYWLQRQSTAKGPEHVWRLKTLGLISWHRRVFDGRKPACACDHTGLFRYDLGNTGMDCGKPPRSREVRAGAALARDFPVIAGLASVRIRLTLQLHPLWWQPLVEKLGRHGMEAAVYCPYEDRARRRVIWQGVQGYDQRMKLASQEWVRRLRVHDGEVTDALCDLHDGLDPFTEGLLKLETRARKARCDERVKLTDRILAKLYARRGHQPAQARDRCWLAMCF